MDFGKLTDLSGVNFRLPPDPPQNAALLSALPKTVLPPTIYLGATGYNMKPWVGVWYPAGAKDRDHLRYYAAQFNTIEHKTTHYRIPDATTVARWRDETPADFRFCPKIPQTISHARDLGLSGGQIGLFCDAMAGLEEKLGCCFLQVPPYFSTRDMVVLERFLERFPKEIPLAVEVRHESFFEPGPAAENFFQLLQNQKIATVVTDVAGRRDVCHLRLTSGQVLVRFVGNQLHTTDYTRIQDWATRLSAWCAAGLREIYFFAHEPDNLLAPDLAAFCVKAFSEKIPEASLRGPKKTGGIQGSLF